MKSYVRCLTIGGSDSGGGAGIQAGGYGATPIIVDPVMVLKSGGHLLSEEGVAVLREKLFPMAELVTPNIPEAESLTGMKIHSKKVSLFRGDNYPDIWGKFRLK